MPTLIEVKHPLVQHKLSIMRDKSTCCHVFRQLLKEISQLLAYEVTSDLALTAKEIETPLVRMQAPTLSTDGVVLISILRAGNGLLDGIMELIPTAGVGFVGLYRDEETLKPVKYYYKVPKNLQNKTVIVVDPMLATGNSSIAAIDLLKKSGAEDIRFLCLLAAPEGIKNMQTHHTDVTIVTGSIDEKLNESGYIVPGLGDAGDRIFATI
jgi:uracil phosphoribosyltransferase